MEHIKLNTDQWSTRKHLFQNNGLRVVQNRERERETPYHATQHESEQASIYFVSNKIRATLATIERIKDTRNVSPNETLCKSEFLVKTWRQSVTLKLKSRPLLHLYFIRLHWIVTFSRCRFHSQGHRVSRRFNIDSKRTFNLGRRTEMQHRLRQTSRLLHEANIDRENSACQTQKIAR